MPSALQNPLDLDRCLLGPPCRHFNGYRPENKKVDVRWVSLQRREPAGTRSLDWGDARLVDDCGSLISAVRPSTQWALRVELPCWPHYPGRENWFGLRASNAGTLVIVSVRVQDARLVMILMASPSESESYAFVPPLLKISANSSGALQP